MNIWVLQHYATPPDTTSGTRHFNIGKRLVEKGHSVTIFASGFNHSTLREERLTSGEVYRMDNFEGVYFCWIRTPAYHNNNWRRVANMLVYSLRVYALSRKLSPPPDLIWASSPHLLSGVVGSLIVRTRKIPFIFEVRDLWPQVLIDIGRYSRRHPMVVALRMVEKHIYKKADTIVVLMPNASEYITALGIPGEKVTYIPHGVDLCMFENYDGDLPMEELSVLSKIRGEGKLLVGYVGAHGPADALWVLVECAEILQKRGISQVHFCVVGEGSEKVNLIELAVKLGLDNISFFDPIPKKLVPSFISRIDLGIVCKKASNLYKYGTSFIKTYDYMACAKPVLWAVNSVDSPVKDSFCGYIVSPENPLEMAEAIMEFLDLDVREREEMGRRGYEYVLANHDSRIIADKLARTMMPEGESDSYRKKYF